MKTLVMRLFIIAGLIAVYDLDQRTTPEVVRISKVSSIAAKYGKGMYIEGFVACEMVAPNLFEAYVMRR
jgi:hypothetical protein